MIQLEIDIPNIFQMFIRDQNIGKLFISLKRLRKTIFSVSLMKCMYGIVEWFQS